MVRRRNARRESFPITCAKQRKAGQGRCRSSLYSVLSISILVWFVCSSIDLVLHSVLLKMKLHLRQGHGRTTTDRLPSSYYKYSPPTHSHPFEITPSKIFALEVKNSLQQLYPIIHSMPYTIENRDSADWNRSNKNQ